MRILQLYNQYRNNVHGEETVIRRTCQLLQAHGHDVEVIRFPSTPVDLTALAKVRLAVQSHFNLRSHRFLVEKFRQLRPEIVHLHNIYPSISPAVFAAARRCGIPTVMSLHHFFLTCPVLTHRRGNQSCLKCVGHSAFNALRYNCRDNWLESAVYASRSAFARQFDLIPKAETRLIALSFFSRNLLIQQGFSPDFISVLPNMADIAPEPAKPSAGGYFLYLGRLTAEKGIETLFRAVEKTGLPLKYAGPYQDNWLETLTEPESAHYLGVLSQHKCTAMLRGAIALIVPSEWFEMCPMVILEAMGQGIPIICSSIGGLPEMVGHEREGLLFSAGNTESLARAMNRLWHDRRLVAQLSARAYKAALLKYHDRRYVDKLLSIYRESVRSSGN